MSSLFKHHGWPNLVVALSLAVIPFLMFATTKQGEHSVRANPAAMAFVQISQQ
jgi:hypothetical protein